MIFAAGLGTRLRPLTNDCPKALVELNGKPLLEHVMLKLIAAGFTDITVNVHHFGQKIIDFLDAKENFGVTVHISDERDQLLDTGGGILKARQWLDNGEPFLVHNADIISDFDIKAMCDWHQRHGGMATLLVRHRNTARYLLFDADNQLRGWVNKKTGETRPEGFQYVEGQYDELAFGGVHVLSPSIFDALSKFAGGRKAFPIVPFYTGECGTHLIKGYQQATDYTWLDVGKPDTLAEAQEWLSSKQMKKD